MDTAESEPSRTTQAILYDFVRDSHIVVAFTTMTVILMTSALYYGKLDWGLAYYGFAVPYLYYGISDCIDLKNQPGSFERLAPDRKLYRRLSLGLILLAEVFILVLMVKHGVPLVQIILIHATGIFLAWYRACKYMPQLRDPEVTLQTFMLNEVIDTVVFTIFTSYTAVWYYGQRISSEPFFFMLALIPIQFSMGVAWKIDSVPNLLNWHLKSTDFGAILRWWTGVSALVILNSVLIGVYDYGYLLLALMPIFNVMMLHVIWMDWSGYFNRFIVYVAYQVALSALLAYLFSRYPVF